jgi:Ca2+-binding EF-hand superfamily protein
MTRTLVITTFAAAAIAGALLSAQQSAEPRRDNVGRRPLIAALDTNHDATVSTEELAAASTSLLALDANRDGQLSLDELRPTGGRGGRGADRAGSGNRDGQEGQERGARSGGRGPRGDAVAGVLDANGDRTLSSEEIAAAPGALKKLDRNADGQLTRDELGPAFGRRSGPPRSNQVAV